MSNFPISFRIAQTIGLSGSAWLSGNIVTYSMATVPAILHTVHHDGLPLSLAVKTWRNAYELGKAQNPKIAAVTAASFLYCAWAVRAGTSLAPLTPRNSPLLYGVAAVLTVGIVPWTLGVMMPTNNRLLAKADSKGELSQQSCAEVEPLLQKWIKLNVVRGLLPFLGAISGVIAAAPWPLEMI
ncbi:hypothetical protein FE257_010596 [Aspergillus nanangensis]|uniref:DUF1772-domain-containing protein n=1 Tax=Aspergillus nanangensis TaxID=2582783 RepID=A0AAD4CK69_ASPNN|nr:hypothetical protein FE257_010596 [Aspergillus nanangensis]